ncbi:hypothetical protein [Hydrocarboniphaga sp.]|uniref:hypothetical protein n=1 Tax=Hydrocarboniphaga sp. TaxID=2033016 RepID=UPI0026386E44|nr:hypothetical protein [Hydrocarboniphaga sp.]
MSAEPNHRMQPGLGVIEWQSRIVVYQMDGARIAWARFLGEQTIEVDESLRAAIIADRQRSEPT